MKKEDKTRPLKVVLDSKSERKFLLENARYIEEKVPEKFKRVIISRDMTTAQRAEQKTYRRRNRRGQPPQSQNTPNSPVAMETERPAPSLIRSLLHLNKLTDSQYPPSDQSMGDPYNDTTVMQDETLVGGFTLSQNRLWQTVGDLSDSNI